MTCRIATWNLNSIRSRLPHLLQWLKDDPVDIVLLQETKVTNDIFPRLEIEDMGYNLAVHGEKSYNGVAILSRFPLEEIVTALPGSDTDIQSRYIEAIVSVPRTCSSLLQGGKQADPALSGAPGESQQARSGRNHQVLRVASVYVPNGQEPGSDKFRYKLSFLERLYAHLSLMQQNDEPLIFGGDYNVAPEPIDVYAPSKLDGTVCFHPEERARLRALLHLGYFDAYRLLHPTQQEFSWWDYRAGSWEAGKGMRIDHLLLNAQAADHLTSCDILGTMRAAEKASDHAPVTANFEF